MEDDIQLKLGKRIKALRNLKGVSQEVLALHSGLHRTYISDIERGVRNVSIKNIEKIAKALNVSIAEIFNT
jgi:transcriptional regulator with XRE-family HTH domain